MIAATLRMFGELETDTVSKEASVFKVIKTSNGHLVALNTKNEPLPYFDENKLSEEIDDVTAEWNLYEALMEIHGIDTTQMILFVGYEPSSTIQRALQSLTKNRNVVMYTKELKLDINKEKFEILAKYMDCQTGQETVAQPLYS